ncbi:MAG TPA: ChbG/HpnK family deacetylase [Planctomycetaceae bacterium]|nr:ChbG/HpnK family deacetylase [Planctomycetaceae bacterium]
MPRLLVEHLVLHADDFGLNDAVNDGILQGFADGLLTSTSVLANAPSAATALARWRVLQQDLSAGNLPSSPLRRRLGDRAAPFDLGVHLNLTQGRPLTGGGYPEQLLDDAGGFPGIGRVFRQLLRFGNRLRDPILAELSAQIERVRDQGASLTHLNGHQYIELVPAVTDVIPVLLERFAIPRVRVALEPRLASNVLLPSGNVFGLSLGMVKRFFARRFLRRMTAAGALFPGAFHGTCHAGRVDLAVMRRFLSRPSSSLWTEVGLHPGCEVPADCLSNGTDGWSDPLARLRQHELQMLTSPELGELLIARRVRLGRLSLLKHATNSRPELASRSIVSR